MAGNVWEGAGGWDRRAGDEWSGASFELILLNVRGGLGHDSETVLADGDLVFSEDNLEENFEAVDQAFSEIGTPQRRPIREFGDLVVSRQLRRVEKRK